MVKNYTLFFIFYVLLKDKPTYICSHSLPTLHFVYFYLWLYTHQLPLLQQALTFLCSLD